MKMTAKNIREIKKLNKQVGDEIQRFVDERKSHSIYLYLRDPEWTAYFAEGSKFSFFSPASHLATVKMVTDSTVGASQELRGLNYAVGQRSPKMPEGTWILEENLFMGNWYLNINYVGYIRLITAA